MMGTTHLVFAYLVYAVLSRPFHLPFDWLYVFVPLTIGSLIPDIDHPKSLISRQSWVFSSVSRLMPHRGPTHSPLATALLTVLLTSAVLYYEADLVVPLSFSLGYLSHLVADSLTRSGVRWLWPFHETKLKFIIYTGGPSEGVFFALALLGLTGLLYPYLVH